MVDQLRKSVEDLEPPHCPKCNIEMKWYRSERLSAEPDYIGHFFHCPACAGVKQVKTRLRGEGRDKPPKLDALAA